MRKKILCGVMISAMTMSVCMAAAAAENENPSATRNELNSSGSIHYSQGEDSVIIDSADLYTLADQLDSFKESVVNQLGEMKTYLTREDSGVPLAETDGIYVVHNHCPDDENAVDPLSLDFSTIMEGVAASQSIPTDPETYDEPSALYKTWEGRLTTDASKGVEDVHIHPATENNLSAGAAAWVNGELLLGTGADVAAASGSDKEFTEYDISKGYIMPENTATAIAFVYKTGVGDNNAATVPTFSADKGTSYTKLYDRNYGGNGYSVKVALYYLKNIPKGAEITGTNGLLFY